MVASFPSMIRTVTGLTEGKRKLQLAENYLVAPGSGLLGSGLPKDHCAKNL
jgi:hypothetical protein